MSVEEYKLAAHALLHLKQFHIHVTQLNSIQSQKVFLNNVILTEENSNAVEADENDQNEIAISLNTDKIATQIRGCLSCLTSLPEDLDPSLITLLIDNPLLSDCRIILNKTESFYAHKYFLIKSSAYFSAMLGKNFEEANKLDIDIEIEYTGLFHLALEFIYTSKINREYCNNEKWIQDVDKYFITLWTAVYFQIQDMINKLLQVFEYDFILSPKFTDVFIPFDLFMRILEGKLSTLRSKDKIIGAQPPMSECRNDCRDTQQIRKAKPLNEYECLLEMAIKYAGKCNDPTICHQLITWIKTNCILRYVNATKVFECISQAPHNVQACIDPIGIFPYLQTKSQDNNQYL
ncbi:hypothetical protein LOD99_8698 [Oopsacas minuta]|uniref:BTB domain-containing protein n=1 Tax=Oopsacas minuta TaxID=111878 RepID=A0AAV7JFN2_9METZ|nr:hypothetical protein LOD99_8698 [Oopsacas minuta]